ncbi:hypothetical protein BSL78_24574 [Apostichopus japonicus]|uniref:Uncharacterized protein n=1 Tax=Stichopus japonicus TaxID=307972 RepID=A0A2G8JS45_STIJA|nr:hypothetical protein BSL78_24574 [Apostichopus japonicus]
MQTKLAVTSPERGLRRLRRREACSDSQRLRCDFTFHMQMRLVTISPEWGLRQLRRERGLWRPLRRGPCNKNNTYELCSLLAVLHLLLIAFVTSASASASFIFSTLPPYSGEERQISLRSNLKKQRLRMNLQQLFPGNKMLWEDTLVEPDDTCDASPLEDNGETESRSGSSYIYRGHWMTVETSLLLILTFATMHSITDVQLSDSLRTILKRQISQFKSIITAGPGLALLKMARPTVIYAG